MARTKKHKLAFSFGIGVISILLGIFLGKDLGTLWGLGLLAVTSFVYGVWHVPWVEKEKNRGEIAKWMGRGIFLTIVVNRLGIDGR